MRVMGRFFKRGSTYWISYYHRGQEHRESTHSASESEARRLLKKRLGESGRGRLVGAREERLTFEHLAEGLVTDYRINRRRSIESAELSLKHLRGYFAMDRVIDITPDRIRSYVLERQREGAANGSINRELAALKRALSLAVQSGQ